MGFIGIRSGQWASLGVLSHELGWLAMAQDRTTSFCGLVGLLGRPVCSVHDGLVRAFADHGAVSVGHGFDGVDQVSSFFMKLKCLNKLINCMSRLVMLIYSIYCIV